MKFASAMVLSYCVTNAAGATGCRKAARIMPRKSPVDRVEKSRSKLSCATIETPGPHQPFIKPPSLEKRSSAVDVENA